MDLYYGLQMVDCQAPAVDNELVRSKSYYHVC